MKKISIIGFGRFGQTLYRLLKDDFDVTIFKPTPITDKTILNNNTRVAKYLSQVYESDVIFFAVPIVKFESVIKEHKKYFQPHHVLIDVLSVKVYPKEIFKKYLKHLSTQAILTHPMFGPDSSKHGFEHLPFIIDQCTSTHETFQFWKKYFENKKLRVVEMTPEMHDKFSANSLGVAQFMGRVLDKFGLKPTPIDSLGAIKLQEVQQQACNDTWELFVGLQNYNPYTKPMRLKLGKAYDALYNKLLPKQVHKKYITFGIQGGKGSFNEQALQIYIQKNNIKKYRVKYLYTSEHVLKALQTGDIDFGQFAIANSTGGLVEESLQAMAKYTFTIVTKFEVLIEHFLMKRKDIALDQLTSIMAHPQGFLQCESHLQEKFPSLSHVVGEGEFVDPAKIAQALFENKISHSTAILGPKILADTYNFDIIAENLQDKKDNMTQFIVVTR